jgi:TRAP-type uncharacterized transport system substrate-binding protein
MAFVQRNLPYIVIAVFVLFLALGILGFVETQQSVLPRDFTILVDEAGGGYDQLARQYQRLFKTRDVDLIIRTTSGVQEALRLLEEGEASIAFIPGYLTKDADARQFTTLGALVYEPLWVFYRPDALSGEPLTRFIQLEGKRVTVGRSGDKTHELALDLLTDSGVTSANTTLLELPAQTAADELLQGEADAVILLDAYQSEVVQQLLRAPGIELASLARTGAYTARQHALSEVLLPAGVVDSRQDIPAEDKTLLASATNMVVRRDLNQTQARSLIAASLVLNSQGDIFSEPLTFPNFEGTDLPVLQEYVSFYNRIKSGGLSLEMKAPFWVAHAIERLIFFMIPLGLLLFLLVTRAPVLMRWHMRGKVLPYYRQLRKLELTLTTGDLAQIEAAQARLAKLDAELAQRVRVSVSYLPEVYQLRLHARYVASELEARKAQLQQSTGQPAQAVIVEEPHISKE